MLVKAATAAATTGAAVIIEPTTPVAAAAPPVFVVPVAVAVNELNPAVTVNWSYAAKGAVVYVALVDVEEVYFAPSTDPVIPTLIVQLADCVDDLRLHSYDSVTVKS
ncbi:hypothetical protein DPV78_003127 [Talaromyces pinophilus]|nr:hypothetical protein DPV78_003127 [Talaromyces pinophilus]